jgi:anti-sigma B factor antagonist
MDDQAPQIMPVVVLPDEIDVTNSDEVYEQLVGAVAPGVDTVIGDLTSTTFCDSSGVHAIMRAHEWAATRDVVLRVAVSPDGSVRRVLQLTGAARIMAVHSSVQDAMRSN